MKIEELENLLRQNSECDEVLIVDDVGNEWDIEVEEVEEKFDGFDTFYPAHYRLKMVESNTQ